MGCETFDLDRPEDPAVAEHLKNCSSCLEEAGARERLHKSLRAMIGPPPTGLRSAIRETLDRVTPARRRAPWLSAAAALMLTAGLFLALPNPSSSLPELVRLSSEFHDRVVAGEIQVKDPDSLQRYFRERLGLEVVTPALGSGTDLVGGCCCDLRERESASPCVLYRVRGESLTLLVVESKRPNLPESARRDRQGREYFIFRCGRNTILLCQSGPLCHLWISRLEESAMLATVLSTARGEAAFSGQRLTLRGVT